MESCIETWLEACSNSRIVSGLKCSDNAFKFPFPSGESDMKAGLFSKFLHLMEKLLNNQKNMSHSVLAVYIRDTEMSVTFIT